MDTGIYTAVYSGVPVYETIIQDVAVMRRRADSYMNATQILKLAGLDKGKRSRVLDREILMGEHEKVQGGYGKFQGTWIPPEQSRQLAQKYGVLELLKPIMDFEPPQDQDEEDKLPTKEQAMAAQKRWAALNPPTVPRRPKNLLPNSPVAPTSPQSSSRASPSPKPSRRSPPPPQNDEHARKKARTSPAPESSSSDDISVGDEHRSLLASIFLSDDIPAVLENNSTGNFGINMPLDELGNTALHWASALARVRVMQHLISRGANLRQMNFAGETPLMRTVMVPNAYETGTFQTILTALLPSLSSLDNRRQTVLHHAALAAGVFGRARAAAYYMRQILQTVAQEKIKEIIDLQNDRGDTALTVAAQVGSSEIMDMLIQAGADKGTENYAGLSCSDYFEGEPEKDTQASTVSAQDEENTDSTSKEPIALSQRGREIINTVQKIVNALDEEYGTQLNAREEELRRLDEELQKTNESLEKTRKELESRRSQSQRMIEAQQRVRNLELAIQTELDAMAAHGIKVPESNASIDEMDEHENIDAHVILPENPSMRIRERLQRLRATVLAYMSNADDLKTAVANLRAQSAEKELQMKQLIAASCNLPIEKIDDLIEPLIQAIESDPPDLDLARVIGFMEKIRRQGAFSEGIVSFSSSSSTTPTATTAADAAIPTIALPEPATG